MIKQPIITRLSAFCDAKINNNNILTEQENETLLLLMSKCISPSAEYCNATTDEEIEKCRVFVNSIDDGFGDASADILAETCTTLATALGKMIADSLVPLMEREKTDEPSFELLQEAMKEMYKTYELMPDLLSKPIILGLFIFSTIEDPLLAMLHAYKCIEIGEKLSADAIKISAKFTHESMHP
jgi:sialic acid synthase SpsE